MQNGSSAAAVVTHRLRKASSKAAVSGLWYLNTVDMLWIGDLVVPCCSCPVIELETGFAADSGHSLTAGLSCGKESRAIWVLHGWLGGNKLEAGCSEPCTQHSHPTHSGLAESGPLYLDRETHTGQQIMWTLNCYCSNVWWVSSSFSWYSKSKSDNDFQLYNIEGTYSLKLANITYTDMCLIDWILLCMCMCTNFPAHSEIFCFIRHTSRYNSPLNLLLQSQWV